MLVGFFVEKEVRKAACCGKTLRASAYQGVVRKRILARNRTGVW